MSYLDKTLIFKEDKIYYLDEGEFECQVMMNWEDNIMKAKADYICENGGDIVENHPQVIEKLKAWAVGKPNVIIVEGGWHDIKDSLSTYDGLLYDTWGDYTRDNFTTVLPTLMKPGGRATWWNNFTDTDDVFFVNGTTYEAISVNPVDNMYFNSDTYYLPKKQF